MASNSCDSNFMSKVTQFQKMNNFSLNTINGSFSKNVSMVFIEVNKCFCLILFHPFKRNSFLKSWKREIIREFRIENYYLSTI